MTDETLTNELARRVCGWKPAPGRFIKSGRSWIPRWRFTPLVQLEHAFQLLDRAADAYWLVTAAGGAFTAKVRIAGRTGNASGEPKARTITMALAQALGLQLPDEAGATVLKPAHSDGPRSRSKPDGI